MDTPDGNAELAFQQQQHNVIDGEGNMTVNVGSLA
jgi:hypothetical protein